MKQIQNMTMTEIRQNLARLRKNEKRNAPTIRALEAELETRSRGQGKEAVGGTLSIGGEVYRLMGTFPLNKREAQSASKQWRLKGYNIRVKARGRKGKDYYLFGRKKGG